MKRNTVKELMKKGMISLLTKKTFIDITVTDLVKESGVARASFYRVYNNIDQVIEDVVEEILDNYKKSVVPYLIIKDEIKIRQIVTSFFVSFKEKSADLFNLLPENFTFLVSKLEQSAISNKDYNPTSSIEEKYIPGLVLVTIVAIIKIWERNGFKETPEELTDFSYQAIGKKYLSL